MKRELVVIVHNVRSLHNVGSVFRTADAVGASKIYLTGITPAPLDRFNRVRPQIAKVALGAERTMPWEKAALLSKLVMHLKKEGYCIVAVEQSKKSKPYYSLPKKYKKVVVILGSETEGLSLRDLKLVDIILEVPMHGSKESLNVSVAAGIVLFRLRYN